eukprot:TRINITY_DN4337_c0_g2_i9.p1 TRINITY_DN4337_c0_g2~~TRINITY_DN4337_c0_g2_i9.p1  ORF type:complete len:653 (-),score=116.72 TRINITY_DN4337_c0_g2_i9:94-2052(-)
MSSRRYDLPRTGGDTLSNGSRSFRNAEEDTLKYDRSHSASWAEGILFLSTQQERALGVSIVENDPRLTRLRELIHKLKIVNTRHIAGYYAKEIFRYIHHIINLNQTIHGKFTENDYEAVNIQMAFLLEVWKDIADFESSFSNSWTSFRRVDILPSSFKKLHDLLHRSWEDLLGQIHTDIKSIAHSKGFAQVAEKTEKITPFCCLLRNFELVVETTRNCMICPLCKIDHVPFTKLPNTISILRFSQLVAETRSELVCGKNNFKDMALKIRNIALEELKFASDCFIFRHPHLEESTHAAYVPIRNIGCKAESVPLLAVSLSTGQPLPQEIVGIYIQYFFISLFNLLSKSALLHELLEGAPQYIALLNDVVVPGTSADNNLIIQNVQLPVNKLRHTKRFPKVIRLNPYSIIRILTASHLVRSVLVGEESTRMLGMQSAILKRMTSGEKFEISRDADNQPSEGSGSTIVFPNRIVTSIAKTVFQLMKPFLTSQILSANAELFCPSYTLTLAAVTNWVWKMCLRYPKGGAMNAACILHSDSLSLADALENMLSTYSRNAVQVSSIQGLESSNAKDIRQIIINLATFHRVPLHLATRTSLACGRFSVVDDLDPSALLMETIRCMRLCVGYFQEKIGVEVEKTLQTLFVLTKKNYHAER